MLLLIIAVFAIIAYEIFALIISDDITEFVKCNEYALYAVVIFLSFLYLYILAGGLVMVKYCRICGLPFEPLKVNQLYCDYCRVW